ncbi:MAG TPA: hypothetical protein VH207_03815 [Chthoniobacterales bacterium]|jgi:serine/threonine-protein kinase|nr:hypothetical protein [Chthoniobacterales bacterium]
MTPTTLDDLKIGWQQLSEKLEHQNTLALHQLREGKLAHFRSGIRPLVAGQFLQLILGAVIAGWSAQFWINHMHSALLLVSGVYLHAYGLMFIAFAVRDLILIRRIDYGTPVLAIQKQLAELRAWHVRAAVVYGFTGSVVWLPVMLIFLHSLGADLSLDQPHKLLWLFSSAVVCLIVNYALMLLARSSGKCGRSLRRSWIGGTVNRAQAMLDEIEQFERELT